MKSLLFKYYSFINYNFNSVKHFESFPCINYERNEFDFRLEFLNNYHRPIFLRFDYMLKENPLNKNNNISIPNDFL